MESRGGVGVPQTSPPDRQSGDSIPPRSAAQIHWWGGSLFKDSDADTHWLSSPEHAPSSSPPQLLTAPPPLALHLSSGSSLGACEHPPVQPACPSSLPPLPPPPLPPHSSLPFPLFPPAPPVPRLPLSITYSGPRPSTPSPARLSPPCAFLRPHSSTPQPLPPPRGARLLPSRFRAPLPPAGRRFPAPAPSASFPLPSPRSFGAVSLSVFRAVGTRATGSGRHCEQNPPGQKAGAPGSRQQRGDPTGQPARYGRWRRPAAGGSARFPFYTDSQSLPAPRR